MKKINIAIAFDEEKLTALKMYLGQKNMTVEKELEKALEALYGKTVPAGVREYLALRTETPTEKKMKNVAPSAVAVNAPTKGDGE